MIKSLFLYWKIALLGVVAYFSVLRRQREEDCHRFEASRGCTQSRGEDIVLLTFKWVLGIQTLAWQALDSVSQLSTPREYSLGGGPSTWRPSLPPHWAFCFLCLSLCPLSERATKHHLFKGNAYPLASWTFVAWLGCSQPWFSFLCL